MAYGSPTRPCCAPVAARIAIAYYPDPEEKIFDTFSWFERIARVSDGFDASGTPTIEARDRLPQRYFTVGHMDLLMTAGGDLLSLACTGAEEWVDLRPAGLELTDPEGHLFQAVPPGGRDRSVPGWSLSRFLLDKMACGLLHCQQLAVRQVSGYAFEMPAYLVHPDGTIEKTVNRPLKGCSLCLVAEFPKTAIDAGYDLAHNRRSWQDGMEETAYPDTRHWNEIWNGHGPEDARWGCADWWQVKNLHLHHHEGHLCACYTDR